MKKESEKEDRGKTATGVFKRIGDAERKSGMKCALCGRANCDGSKCRAGGSGSRE